MGGNGSDYAYYGSATSGVAVYLNYGAGYSGEAAGDVLNCHRTPLGLGLQ